MRVYADLNSNFAFDEGTEPSTLTAGDGTYDLAGLSVGNAFIRQVKPGGFDQTQPFAPNQNALSGYAVSVQNESDVFTDRDFGNFETAPATSSIGDFVWIDALENDVQDDGERGLAGVTVRLFLDGSGVPLRTTTTDENGAYLFENLVADDYFVEFVRPQGFGFVTQGAGSDTDSDANVNTGRTLAFTLAEDEAKTDIDAGLVATRLFVTIDYSLDTNGFFDDPARRTRLQAALNTLIAPLNDDLDAIVPQGGNTWSATFTHPGTGQAHQVDDMVVARNEIVIFAGGRDLGGSVGLGELGGTTAGGAQGFQDTVASRGQAGALLATPTDIGIWGGAISFDTTHDLPLRRDDGRPRTDRGRFPVGRDARGRACPRPRHAPRIQSTHRRGQQPVPRPGVDRPARRRGRPPARPGRRPLGRRPDRRRRRDGHGPVARPGFPQTVHATRLRGVGRHGLGSAGPFRPGRRDHRRPRVYGR